MLLGQDQIHLKFCLHNTETVSFQVFFMIQAIMELFIEPIQMYNIQLNWVQRSIVIVVDGGGTKMVVVEDYNIIWYRPFTLQPIHILV